MKRTPPLVQLVLQEGMVPPKTPPQLERRGAVPPKLPARPDLPSASTARPNGVAQSKMVAGKTRP